MSTPPPLLEVTGLSVTFTQGGVPRPVLEGVSLRVARGEVLALVGESGSGKSMTALAIMGLLPRGDAIRHGSVRLDGEELQGAGEACWNRIRGGRIGMLFQQPHASLDPTATVRTQVAEPLRRHRQLGRAAAGARVVELLRETGIPKPGLRADLYAHQLSGGMAQRVMIAAALSADPDLLIADEPTTALDVTIQLQILRLLARERRERRLGILLITHDFGVVAALADRVAVMYAGRIVEEGPAAAIMSAPAHPYTQSLVAASLLRVDATGALDATDGAIGARATAGCRFLPRCPLAVTAGLADRCAAEEPAMTRVAGDRSLRCWAGLRDTQGPRPPVAATAAAPSAQRIATLPFVVVRDVVKTYEVGGLFSHSRLIRSLDKVSFSIDAGEAVGLVGESGSGKSTLARMLLRLAPMDGGQITVAGQDIARLSGAAARSYQRTTQLIFQDAAAALDPRMTIGESLQAPLRQAGEPAADSAARMREMLVQVGLDESFLRRLPEQCSGGQLQRIVIARALLLRPKFLVCDEPTSALDASVRAQILNLLAGLRRRLNLTILMISHDLRVVAHLCDRVAVLYLGRIVEIAPSAVLFAEPRHPYTRALIAASLLERDGLEAGAGLITGDPPSPLAPPSGCRFHPRCPMAEARCRSEEPRASVAGVGHDVSCHLWNSPRAVAMGSA